VRGLELVKKLARIESMIRDRNFTATHPSIAADLGCSIRQVQTYFEALGKLGAPLINHGRSGWELAEGWDLWAALQKYCEIKSERE
jgi:hypothetical protein